MPSFILTSSVFGDLFIAYQGMFENQDLTAPVYFILMGSHSTIMMIIRDRSKSINSIEL